MDFCPFSPLVWFYLRIFQNIRGYLSNKISADAKTISIRRYYFRVCQAAILVLPVLLGHMACPFGDFPAPAQTEPQLTMDIHSEGFGKLLGGLYFHIFVVFVVVYMSRDVTRVLLCRQFAIFSPTWYVSSHCSIPSNNPQTTMDITEKEFESV